jgi:hypothetical protein
MFNIFKKYYKNLPIVDTKTPMPKVKPPKEEECGHDWEVVSEGEYYAVYHSFSLYSRLKEYTKDVSYYIDKEHCAEERGDIYNYYWMTMKNKVCLKCGECYDGDKIAEEWIKEQEEAKKKSKQEKIQRKELAKKIWEEKCCGK